MKGPLNLGAGSTNLKVRCAVACLATHQALSAASEGAATSSMSATLVAQVVRAIRSAGGCSSTLSQVPGSDAGFIPIPSLLRPSRHLPTAAAAHAWGVHLDSHTFWKEVTHARWLLLPDPLTVSCCSADARLWGIGVLQGLIRFGLGTSQLSGARQYRFGRGLTSQAPRGSTGCCTVASSQKVPCPRYVFDACGTSARVSVWT